MMRIRRKHNYGGVTYKLIEESKNYYVCCVGGDTPDETSSFPKEYYEPVQTETWRDVTGECEYLAEGPDHLQGLWHGRTIVCPPAYRARKVQASRALDDDDIGRGEEEVCWHFIIEKREP
jgi:hypothetical protein